jgi:type IV pilus assembly protein PilB
MSNQGCRCLGEILAHAGLVSESELQKARELGKASGRRITDALIEIGAVTEAQMQQALAREFGMACVDLADLKVDRGLLGLVPREVAIKHCVCPVALDDGHLVLATADPLDTEADDLVAAASGKLVKPVLAPRSELRAIIQNYYQSDDVVFEAASCELGEDGMEVLGAEDTPVTLEELETSAEQVPVVRLVSLIISGAYRRKASDIHVEPRENTVVVRYRLDGQLHTVLHLPKRLQPPVISRVKVIADMDIANSRSPQDGRAKVRIGERNLDLRVSTLPTLHGETVVIRLLDQGQEAYTMEGLGLRAAALEALHTMLSRPKGMILLTGPTGSGKTTTLYAALNHLRQDTNNIVTVEDPVEYQIPGVNQVQVNPRAGITFASGLRSILRQDPDVIMVGEMRDLETAEIALRSALTGHLVLSTVHTNDAPCTIARMVDMGLEPYLIASSLLVVIAQRLVRRICPKCKVPDPEALPPADGTGAHGADGPAQFYRGAGCAECDGTGYRGRIGVFEIMVISEELAELISAHEPTAVIAHAAHRAGMRTLLEDGLAKAVAGITSLAEVVRVCGSDHEGLPPPAAAMPDELLPPRPIANTSAAPVVLVAGEARVGAGLRQALRERYCVREVPTEDLDAAIEREQPAAAVFAADGTTAPRLCRSLRRKQAGATAFFLALGPKDDELRILESGADAFAPLDTPAEVIAARIAAALRRR